MNTVTLTVLEDLAAPTLEARFADGWDKRKARAFVLLLLAWIETKTPAAEKWTAREDALHAAGKPHKVAALVVYPHYAPSRRRLLEAERGRILDLLRAAAARFSGAYANENNLFTDADLAIL